MFEMIPCRGVVLVSFCRFQERLVGVWFSIYQDSEVEAIDCFQLNYEVFMWDEPIDRGNG